MGPEKRWQFRDDLGWTMELGGIAPVEGRRRPQRDLVPRRQPRVAARLVDLPARRGIQRQRPHDLADAVDQHAADLRRDPGQALRHLRPGRLADRADADAQPGAALRRAVRLVQRGPRRPARAHRRTAGPAVRDVTRCRFRSIEGADARGDRNNFGPRVGAGVGRRRRRPHQRARRLRAVLRQHAHAAELRRADVAAEPADHHQQPELPRRAAGPFARSVRVDRAAEHHRDGQRQRQRLRAPVQHRRVAR